jgi:putative heme-binding domain-containing protein
MGGDDWGNRFPVFNNIPVRHVVMDDRYLKGQMMLAGGDVVPNISPTNDGNRVFAITHPNLLIPQPIGFFTSACGPSVYRGDALPESLRGSYFVSEPVQNLVQRRVLVPDVSTFVAEYAHTNREFLASTDRWFHPVFTATGPDGALYVVDFYRDLVEHPHWVAPELRDKVDWRKGEEHGRIWRIRGQGTKAAKAPPCSRASDVDLVKALESANGWTRDTAHRLLVERAAVGMIDELERMARNGATAQSRVHALNILDAFWGDDDAGHRRARELLRTCLSDAEPRVREQAVRIAERHLDSELMAALLKRVNDDDARVRLQLACSAGAFPVASSRLAMLTGLARHNQLDPWQALAILGSAGDRPWLLGERLKPMLAEPTEPQLEFLERLAASVAAGTHGADLGSMSAWLGDSRAPHRFVLWASALEAASPAKRAELLKDFPGGEALASARDRRLPERVRLAAIRCSAFRRDALDALVELLASGESRAIQIATARAFFQANDAAAVKLVFARFHAVERNTRREIIASSVRRSGSASALLDAVEKHLVPLAEVDPAARHALEKFSDNAVKERARRLFASSVSADRAAVVEQFKPALKLSGDRARGAALFERACAVCHQMQGVGAQVGPDLSGIGQQPRETLLVQILDPSRQVLPDFVAYHAETKDGESYSGFVVSENAESVTLRRANEPDLTLPRARLAELRTNGKSMMPDGLEAGMSLQDMADLLEFLRRPDRTLFTQSP